MAEVKKIQLPDGEYYVMSMVFEPKAEPWSVYELADGGRVRLRTTALQIYRVVDEQGNPQTTANGDPWFIVNHQTTVVPE